MTKRTTTGRQPVWRVLWDGGTPWHNGEEIVYWSRGKYRFQDEYGGEPLAFEELLPLLEGSGLNYVNDTTQSIDSPLFSAEQIVSMLEVEAEVGHILSINGETWVCVAPDVLERAEQNNEK